MAYPDQSNFQSGAAQSAWFKVASTGGDQSSGEVVSIQGRTFVESLQENLIASLGSGPNQTYDGTVSASDIRVDGKWGPITNRALYAVLSNDFQGEPDHAAALAAVRADATNQAIGPLSLRYALAEAFSIEPGAIYVSPSTVMPSWNNPAPVPEPTAPTQPVSMPDPGTDLPGDSGGGSPLRTLGIVAGVGLLGAAVVVAAKKKRRA